MTPQLNFVKSSLEISSLRQVLLHTLLRLCYSNVVPSFFRSKVIMVRLLLMLLENAHYVFLVAIISQSQ